MRRGIGVCGLWGVNVVCVSMYMCAGVLVCVVFWNVMWCGALDVDVYVRRGIGVCGLWNVMWCEALDVQDAIVVDVGMQRVVLT